MGDCLVLEKGENLGKEACQAGLREPMGREGSEPDYMKTGFLFPLEALLGILGQAKTFKGKKFDSAAFCQACRSFCRRSSVPYLLFRDT